MEDKKKYSCDPETGYCSVPNSGGSEQNLAALPRVKDKPLHIVYFSDPICSYCWNIEGFLRRLTLEYGQYFTLEERMGGLLRKFGEVDYEGQVTDPEVMARAWDKTSEVLQMPINGSVWLNDPLTSSFPASIAFKAAELQGHDKGMALLRLLREDLFVEAKNISKDEVILEAAKSVGLDMPKFERDYSLVKGEKLFNDDLDLCRELNVDLFPTLFIINEKEEVEELAAPTVYAELKEAVKKMAGGAILAKYDKGPLSLMKKFGTMTLKEMSVLTEMTFPKAADALEQLVVDGKIIEIKSPKGSLWKMKA